MPAFANLKKPHCVVICRDVNTVVCCTKFDQTAAIAYFAYESLENPISWPSPNQDVPSMCVLITSLSKPVTPLKSG